MSRRPKHPYLRYRKRTRSKKDVSVDIVDLSAQWIPQTTRRIRRLRDGKVFSNSLGVALLYSSNVYGTARQVEQNCDGHATSVYVGGETVYEEFEWADDYEDTVDRGNLEVYLNRVNLELLAKLDEAKKLELTNDATIDLLSGRYTKFNTFKKMRTILTEMSPRFSNIVEPICFGDFYQSYADIYAKYAPIEMSISFRSMARHMWQYKDFYAVLYGLVLAKLPYAKGHGQRIIHVSYGAEVVDETYEDFLTEDDRKSLVVVKFRDELYPRKVVKVNRRYRAKSIPIYVEAIDYTYHSISMAFKEHLVSKQQIISCCFGDIAKVSSDGGLTWVKFSYGSFDNLDPEVDVNLTLQKYYEGNMGSRTGTPVFEAIRKISFASIREASIKLSIPASFVRYSISHNAEVELLDADYQKSGAEPIADYYRFFVEGSEEFEEYMADVFANESDSEYQVV